MIGPGWIPGYRPRPQRRHTLAYTRSRRRTANAKRRANAQANPQPLVNTEIVLFDHAPSEFPVATAVPRQPRARMTAAAADFKRWLVARWDWFKPRTVPCAVACLGMLAVLKSADYLAHQNVDQAGCANAPRAVLIDLAPR